MLQTRIPTTVNELLTSVGQNVSNIAKHREAMAEVAAQAQATVPQPAQAGGETK